MKTRLHTKPKSSGTSSNRLSQCKLVKISLIEFIRRTYKGPSVEVVVLSGVDEKQN